MNIRKANLNRKRNDVFENKQHSSGVLQKTAAKQEKNHVLPTSNTLFQNHISIRKSPAIKLNHPPLSPKEPIRISNSDLADLIKLAEKLHPLPRELQMKINKTHRNHFISQLRILNTQDDLADFAFGLNQQDLALLFPILATVNKKSHSEKLKKIISLRSGKVLYAHGWVTLQYIYPDNRFSKTLSQFCRDLENENFPFQRLLNESEQESQAIFKALPYPHFDWSKVHLITKIAMPDNRRFMNDIVNYILENKLSLQEFFRQFGIYEDLSLGIAIQRNYDVERLEKSLTLEADTRLSWKDLFHHDNDEPSDELY